MSRLALWNMAFGFLIVAILSVGGAVMSFYVSDAIQQAPLDLLKWNATLQKSAHAHGNLFGILHILFGLSLPYSQLSWRVKVLQTIGLAAGTLGAGPLMWIRSMLDPNELAVMLITSAGLAAAIATLLSHSGALFLRARRP